jgi:hypothetical protein
MLAYVEQSLLIRMAGYLGGRVSGDDSRELKRGAGCSGVEGWRGAVPVDIE